MKRSLHAVLAIMFVSATGSLARADDKDPSAVLDKAIKALGGEEKLKKIDAITWTSKADITFNDNTTTSQSRDPPGSRSLPVRVRGGIRRQPVQGRDGPQRRQGLAQVRRQPMELEEDALANEKRRVYLEILPSLLVRFKGKGFKLESAGEEKVGDKPAAGIKVTGPDGKDFTLYFDKESGLPVKLVAKVVGFGGDEYTQETTFKDYKDFDGIKKATKVDSKRDGEEFIKSEITEFKVLDKVDSKTFSEPE